MDTMRFVGGLTAVGLLAAGIGCAGSTPEPPAPPVPVAQTDPGQSAADGTASVTFTDKKLLKEQTGPVDQDAPTEFTETSSGLKYRILRKSDGKKPTAADEVTVNYAGWLDDGDEFDSSYMRGQPISFPLRRVIAGWTEGLQLIGEGGMIELWIPSNLGYGAGGKGEIPPNATLHFIVELIKVK